MNVARLWSLPGPSRFVESVVGDVSTGRCVCVIQPTAGTPAGIHGAVKAAAGPAREWDALTLGPGGDIDTDPVVDALFELFGMAVEDDDHRLDVTALATHPDWTHRIVWVNAHRADDDQLGRWARFLDAYIAAARPLDTATPTVFITACTGAQADLLPAGDLSLTRHWWWGAIGRLDTAVHVDAAVRGRGLDPALVAAIVEVAGFDLALADELAVVWKGDVDALAAIVAGYADDAGIVALADLPELPAATDVPGGQVRRWWADGLVDSWDGVPCWHRAAAGGEGTVHGDSAAAWLHRLVWRAQLGTVLPEIEASRHQIAVWCDAMRPHLTPGKFETSDIRAFEYGQLQWVFREMPFGRRDMGRKELLGWLEEARNTLAHAGVLDPNDLARGRRLMNRPYASFPRT